MVTALLLGTGGFWTAAYILLIRIGVRERTYGMPIAAFATNISWEFMFAFVRSAAGLQHWINVVWFAFDCAIGYTVVRFGPAEFKVLPRWGFYGALVVLLCLAYPGMNLASEQFDAGKGSITAFGSNLVMSGLFLAMLLSRGSMRGQSLGIAVCKMLGTACASAAMLADTSLDARYHVGFMYYLYVGCFVVDLAYVAALVAVRRTSARPAVEPELQVATAR
jgi:hypothetical protein